MRIEKDTLGKVKLPDNAYYGAQTQRAVGNFPISGLKLPRRFIRAQGIVKLAAARANGSLGQISKKLVKAIEKAALEVIKGTYDDHFVVDVYQAGAGTSQVNMAQSTNDTIPTSIYISSYEAVRDDLVPALIQLQRALHKKAGDFDDIVKSGRTHMQDAVPIRLGQEFGGYAEAVKRDIERVRKASDSLLSLPIGGNALGTGINAAPGFRISIVKEIRRITGIKFRSCESLFEGIQNVNPALEVSASIRGVAVTLTKIANDIRLLSSGPRTGFAEIQLPAVQPGSSIMPGKVNPVMAEMLNMVCYQVMGNDTAIAYATQASQLELNVMMPVIAHNLLFSIEILSNGIAAFTDKCLKGIKADRIRCNEYADATLAMATALNPVIGYSSAAEISKESYRSGKSVKQVSIEKGLLTEKEADKVLDPRKLTGK